MYDNIGDYGKIKDIDAITKKFNFLNDAKEIIVYCGSGIAGALNFVLLDELVYKSKLYVGSASDWKSHKENELETGYNNYK